MKKAIDTLCENGTNFGTIKKDDLSEVLIDKSAGRKYDFSQSVYGFGFRMETVSVLTKTMRCIVLETTEKTLLGDGFSGYVEEQFLKTKLFGIRLVDTKENLKDCLSALLPEPVNDPAAYQPSNPQNDSQNEETAGSRLATLEPDTTNNNVVVPTPISWNDCQDDEMEDGQDSGLEGGRLGTSRAKEGEKLRLGRLPLGTVEVLDAACMVLGRSMTPELRSNISPRKALLKMVDILEKYGITRDMLRSDGARRNLWKTHWKKAMRQIELEERLTAEWAEVSNI